MCRIQTSSRERPAEVAARAAFVSELIAEGMVERQAETLVRRESGREFMVEIRLHDITEVSS
jgi:hypothetical protein